MEANRVWPRKRPKRTRAMPASAPSTEAMVADTKPTLRVTAAAWSTALFCSSSPYQWVEKPPQTVTRRDLLKLKMIKIAIGR